MIQTVGCQIAGYLPQIFCHIWMANVCVILTVGVSFVFSTARTLPFYYHLRWGGGGVVECSRPAAIP